MTAFIIYIVCLSVIRAAHNFLIACSASWMIVVWVALWDFILVNQHPRNLKAWFFGRLYIVVALKLIYASDSLVLFVIKVDLLGLVTILVILRNELAVCRIFSNSFFDFAIQIVSSMKAEHEKCAVVGRDASGV